MAKIAVVLVLVGLTVMASAYNIRRPHFDQGLQTGKQDERAQLMEHLPGIAKSNDNWSCTHNHVYNLLYTLVLSADIQEEEEVADVDVSMKLPEPLLLL